MMGRGAQRNSQPALIDLSGDLSAARVERSRQQEAPRQVEQAKQQLSSGAADFRVKFIAERAAKLEAERRAKLARQGGEQVQAKARRKAELERVSAKEREAQSKSKGQDKGPSLGWAGNLLSHAKVD